MARAARQAANDMHPGSGYPDVATLAAEAGYTNRALSIQKQAKAILRRSPSRDCRSRGDEGRS